ncbi:MAG: LPS export ABC transporter permease LptG, partial [Pseudomonadota bacterium]
ISVLCMVLGLFALVVLTDLIENLRFAGQVAGGDFGLAMSLTLLRAPAVTQLTLPFVFLFASVWTFNQLNRRSEISVMRSAGLSIWRLISPGALVAAIAGLVIILALDPLSTRLMAMAEETKARQFGGERNLVEIFADGIWLQQREPTMHLIMRADRFDQAGAALEDVTLWRFDDEHIFLERIDATKAFLSGRTMELHDARLKSVGEKTQRESPIYAIGTSLSPEDLGERAAPPETLSLWKLPRFIELAETAGLSTLRYDMRFHELISTPLKLVAMVLIAAAFSLRPQRQGGMLGFIVLSVGAGFALYILVEVSTALGLSGASPASLAAWTPAVVATIAAITALLHLEDG